MRTFHTQVPSVFTFVSKIDKYPSFLQDLSTWTWSSHAQSSSRLLATWSRRRLSLAIRWMIFVFVFFFNLNKSVQLGKNVIVRINKYLLFSQAMKDAECTKSDIGEVILVGGRFYKHSFRIPYFISFVELRRRWKENYDGTAWNITINCLVCVRVKLTSYKNWDTI